MAYRYFRSFTLQSLGILLGEELFDCAFGPIEGELAKKQVPIDLGRTPKALIPLISKPIYVHGGLRLAKENESKYSATFSSAGVNKIQVSITSGSPKTFLLSLLFQPQTWRHRYPLPATV